MLVNICYYNHCLLNVSVIPLFEIIPNFLKYLLQHCVSLVIKQEPGVFIIRLIFIDEFPKTLVITYENAVSYAQDYNFNTL
jgi:hypothetical protein